MADLRGRSRLDRLGCFLLGCVVGAAGVSGCADGLFIFVSLSGASVTLPNTDETLPFAGLDFCASPSVRLTLAVRSPS